MKLKLKINKRFLYRDLPVLIVGLLMLTCVNFNGEIEYPKYLIANEYATFKVPVKVVPEEDKDGVKLIVAFCAPKSWLPEENTTVTYTSNVDDGEVRMTLIPASESPKNRPGMTWAAALYSVYGYGNILDDMQWIAFESAKSYNAKNGEQMLADVSIKTLVGPDNMRVKLGFFINHSDNGFKENDNNHYKQMFTDCIDIVEGEGEVIDFCEFHINMVQPTNATQEDIFTFQFQGDVIKNDLVDAKVTEIYFNAVAYTTDGETYRVTENSEKNKMIRESEYGNTHNITFWPVGYFGVPEGKTIEYIEYFFTNKDGSIWVKDVEEGEDEEEDPVEIPFVRNIVCK